MKNVTQRPRRADLMPVGERYMTRAELAIRLGKHLRTVDLLLKRRSIPYYKIGRHVRFKWSEVEAQLHKRCRVAPRS